MKCPHCGKTVRKGNFCPYCGSKFLRGKYCRNCQEIIDVNAEVCPHCGAQQSVPRLSGFQWWYGVVLAGVLLIGLSVGFAIHVAVASRLPVEEPSPQPSATPAADPQPGYEITYQRDWVYRDAMDDPCCYGLVEIENTGNVNLLLNPSTFRFQDPEGEEITTCRLVSSFPKVVAPGEKGYFYASMAPLEADMDEDTEYEMVPRLKIERTEEPAHNFPVSNVVKQEGDLFAAWRFDGSVKNDRDHDMEYIQVECLIYDGDGKPLAACKTNVKDVGAGQRKDFSISTLYLKDMELKMEDAEDYQIFAYDPTTVLK